MADNPYLDCGADWGTITGNVCDQFSSGMDAAILFRVGVTAAEIFTNTTDPVLTPDATKIQALLDTGDAKIISGLRIGIEAPSAVTTDAYMACQAETVATYDRTLTWKDRKVTPEAVRFYNTLNAASGFRVGAMLVHECAAARCRYIDKTMAFIGGAVSPEGEELQRFEFTVQWKDTGDADIVYEGNVWDLVASSASGI